MTQSVKRPFPRRIRELREEQGFSQEELARRLDVSWMTVSRWERGKTEPPLSMLRRIAEVFGVEPSALISKDKAA